MYNSSVLPLKGEGSPETQNIVLSQISLWQPQHRGFPASSLVLAILPIAASKHSAFGSSPFMLCSKSSLLSTFSFVSFFFLFNHCLLPGCPSVEHHWQRQQMGNKCSQEDVCGDAEELRSCSRTVVEEGTERLRPVSAWGRHESTDAAEKASWQSSLEYCTHPVCTLLEILSAESPMSSNALNISSLPPAIGSMTSWDESLGNVLQQHLALSLPLPLSSHFLVSNVKANLRFCVFRTQIWCQWSQVRQDCLPKLVVVQIIMQHWSASNQTSSSFCSCLAAWQSVGSLSNSICYSFGEAFEYEDGIKGFGLFC